jgi:uncharacterized RDD family membrane protein YckC
MSAVKLVGLEGPLRAKSRYFTDGDYVLGRDETCDVYVDDASVSGKHATLRVANSKVTIQDHDSLNGTYVNDDRRQTRVVLETLHDRYTFALGPNTSFGVRIMEVRSAGFWIRLLAILIDGVLLAIPSFLGAFLIGMVVGLAYSRTGPPSPADQFEMRTVIQILVWIWQIILPLTYVALMNGARGQTLGKMAVGLKIVRPDLGKISYGQALLRYFMQVVLGVLSIGIMYIVLAINLEKRGWHDLIADTRVVHWKDLETQR